jgi:hypothetical protein
MRKSHIILQRVNEELHDPSSPDCGSLADCEKTHTDRALGRREMLRRGLKTGDAKQSRDRQGAVFRRRNFETGGQPVLPARKSALR